MPSCLALKYILTQVSLTNNSDKDTDNCITYLESGNKRINYLTSVTINFRYQKHEWPIWLSISIFVDFIKRKQ